jgi:hypothetical protein
MKEAQRTMQNTEEYLALRNELITKEEILH